jgi:hypothetical protein
MSLIAGANQIYKRLRFLPLIGSRAIEQERIMNATSTSPFAESFRLLALNVNVALKDKPVRGVVVMSAFPDDGRSFVAANLAVAMSERQPTILHDGHSRAESPVGSLFNPHLLPSGNNEGPRGLPSPLDDLPRSSYGPQLWITGSRYPHPSDTDRLGEIVRTASGAGITTVVDTPPASLSSEAFALAQEVGKVLYVVRRRSQSLEIHRQIREQLERLDAQMIGIVTNEG